MDCQKKNARKNTKWGNHQHDDRKILKSKMFKDMQQRDLACKLRDDVNHEQR